MAGPTKPRTKVAANGQPIAMQPADWEIPDVAAMQAPKRGDATAEQQQRALHFVKKPSPHTPARPITE